MQNKVIYIKGDVIKRAKPRKISFPVRTTKFAFLLKLSSRIPPYFIIYRWLEDIFILFGWLDQLSTFANIR